jgi:sec-independent protein translocase protein TatB
MFDIGWTELVVIAIVAIILIGPKDLPVVIRTVAAWVRRARALMREFQSGVDEVLRDSEVETLRREIDAARHLASGDRPGETLRPPGPAAPGSGSGAPSSAAPDDKPKM